MKPHARSNEPRFRMRTITDIRDMMTLEEVCARMQSAHEMGFRAGLKAAQEPDEERYQG